VAKRNKGFIYLTPLIPLSMIWIYIPIMRGKLIKKRGFASLRLSFGFLLLQRGRILKRGVDRVAVR